MLQQNKKMQSCVQSQHPPTLSGIIGERKKKEKVVKLEKKIQNNMKVGRSLDDYDYLKKELLRE
jgi:hypothetical protein